MGNKKKNYCCNCRTQLGDGETICSVCGYDNTLYQNPKSALPEKTLPSGKEGVIVERASLLGNSDLKPQKEEKKEEPRKPAAESRPKKNPNRLLPVLLAVLLAAGFFLYNGIRQNQLNTAGTQTAVAGTITQSALELEAQQTADEQTALTAQAGMTAQAAAAETQTARETQEALSLQQTGTAWNLTAAAEYQQTQTQAAADALATQAEQESRMEQTAQAETQAVLNTVAALQSEQTAAARFATQEAQIHQTQTREAEEMRETQVFLTGQTETQAAAEAPEQTRVMEEQQTAAQAAVEDMGTRTADAEQALAVQMTATRSAERMATAEALEETQYAFHVMETEASFAETKVAIDLRMTAAAATQTKAAEPTATPSPTETAVPTPVPTNTPKPTEKPKPVVRVGEIISLGHYEQDGDLTNGPEAIEWLVLAVEEGRALVISRYGLDVKPYNKGITDVTWETSTLRAWLNGEFYNSVFSSEEKGRIRQVTLKNPDNAGTKGGRDTTDRIFLLSIDEAKYYFMDDEARRCEPTIYAKKNGAYVSKEFAGTTWWWLRTPGISPKSAAGVGVDGKLCNFGGGVDEYNLAVRPVFWLEL